MSIDDLQEPDDRQAALDALAYVPPPGFDDPLVADATRREDEPAEEADGPIELTEPGSATSVLRRGIAASPELRVGLAFTLGMALASAIGRIVVPVLIQQVIDRGVTGPDGFRPEFVYPACGVAMVVTGLVVITSRETYLRLVRAAEATLYGLRVRAFDHIHRLSMADHTEAKRGVLVARVTSDLEQLARFAQWGAVAWIVNTVVVVGVLATMLVYSWQLALVTVAVYVPLVPLLRWLQRAQLRAYDLQRTRVGETLTAISESVMGASVIRAYGFREPTRRRVGRAIDRQYDAQLGAAKYFSILLPLGDLFGGAALAAVAAVGVWWGPGWGMTAGEVIAFLFLVNLILSPIAELAEVLDQTQTAIAGWRKVLDLLDMPIEIIEPENGAVLPSEPLSVRAEALEFAYRDGDLVLRGIDIDLEPGADVAVVGETGSGKTTLAKLLCRLADPVAGRILIGGVDLREIAPESRRTSVRMVPQDGFLFDKSVRENVRYGREGADDQAVEAAFRELGLHAWVARLPGGLDTPVGERGENLSVGERQLVALVRAQLADPGLLILDEATSNVDPETERALTSALARLAEGRTTVSVAHRLSTAEAADRVLVFDDGRVVEQGTHAELVAAGGRYADLYESWLGNTRLDAIDARAAG